ncbi:hypothetical protein [Nocardia sp. NPDC005366]|uniref:hypothetical protein n=1 Tax=Nocardia sp. NPDC005366 TaxID=3156878 RepID=UPI0033A59CC9
MRIIRPDDDNDRDDEHDPEQGPTRAEIGDFADEVEDYLAHVLANVPPPDSDEPPYTPPSRSGRPIGPKRPALHLVPNEDGDRDRDAAAVDPEAVIEAGRSARTRMVRSASGGSAVVVLAGAFACWGESFAVTGPLAVYGAGWVGYLWWNAALRPSFPETVTAVTGGIGRGVSGAVSILTNTRRQPEGPETGATVAVTD